MAWRTISKVLATTDPEPLSATSVLVAQCFIQALRANVGAVELSAESNVAAGEGIEMPKPTADITLGGIGLSATGVGNNIDLSKFYLLGAVGDGVNILYETF